MIKKLKPDQVAERIVNLISQFRYCAVTDYSAYDGSQRKRHADFENYYIA